MTNKRYEAKRKPDHCPSCGSERIAEIMYGLSAFSPELERDLKAGVIVLGGCCVTGDDPKWQCGDCKVEIYKKKRKNPNEQFLSEINVEIAGTQYYEAKVSEGKTVYLEREPDNPHDSNAICVKNRYFDTVGHLPRRVASWLAPLIDLGKVRIQGMLSSKEIEGSKSSCIDLSIYLCTKGYDILKVKSDPVNEVEALHQAVLLAFKEAGKWDTPDVIDRLGERLNVLSKHDTLPETRLLLALFPSQARLAEKRQAEAVLDSLRKAMSKVRVDKGLHYKNITLFPLFIQNGHEPDYMLMEEALKSKDAEVREISEEGSVPEVLVVNRSGRHILIPEGEIFIGAKQDRVVNITILVGASSEFNLPVSCVERGRWRHTSKTFSTSYYAPPNVRARKTASVRENRRRTGSMASDQHAVWDDVDNCLKNLGVKSETGSLVDGYKAVKNRLNLYRKNISVPKGAAGVIVCGGNRVIGMDIFDSSKTFKKLWPRLSSAYFMEAAAFNKRRRKTPKDTAKQFIAGLPRYMSPADKRVGIGTELDITGPDITGSALWNQGRLYHLSAFTMEK